MRVGGRPATVRRYLAEWLVDELHLAQSPALLGRGEPLLTGLDLRALGYVCTERFASPYAMHVVLTRRAAPGR